MTLVEFIELCIDRLACGAGTADGVMLQTAKALGVDEDFWNAALNLELGCCPETRQIPDDVDDRIASLQAALKLARERGL